MKNLLVIFVLLFYSIFCNVFADDVEVEVSPKEPVINESFFVTFRIKIIGDSSPYISFTPSGVQVSGKKEQGVSISTVVINGKFTTTKEQNIVYELMAERAGSASLKNIKVEVGGKNVNLKDINLNILSAPKRIPDAFMEAEVSKTKAYVGEGIDVNYYLYFKSSIAANDIKDFPKLNRFIKRFHHINSPVEAVQYHGQVLKRILAYSARIYPEKPGKAIIDPMKISVQVVEIEYGNMGGFGFGQQRIKNKDLASNVIEIEVLPLPSENVPAGFTGLVGEHEFLLTPGKDKYIVNEPIEIKLEVRGKGALEKMEAPLIYTDNNLEAFDTKGEVTETGTTSAKKVFEYTYLARSPMNIKERIASFAYFDPAKGIYVEKKVNIPGFQVGGVANDSIAKNGTSKDLQINSSESQGILSKIPFMSGESNPPLKLLKIEKAPLGLVGPIFKNNKFNLQSITFLNLFLCLVIIFIAFSLWKFKNDDLHLIVSNNKEAKILVKKLKKTGMNYSDLYQLLKFLVNDSTMSIYDSINNSQLEQDSKNYFKKLLELCEQKGYGQKKSDSQLNFEVKHFKELLKII
jgi:hypothetical protein